MRLSEGNPFKTCANPQAHNQKLVRANVYENEMVWTYRDLNRSGASPTFGGLGTPKNLLRLFFRNNLARLKITSEANNNLKKVIFDLVLMFFVEHS